MACPCKRNSLEVPSLRDAILIYSLGEAENKCSWGGASEIAWVVMQAPLAEGNGRFATAKT